MPNDRSQVIFYSPQRPVHVSHFALMVVPI